MAPWSQGGGFCPAREGEAGSLDGVEAPVGRGKAKLFPLRVEQSGMAVGIQLFELT
jgi:hypothetical protein